MLTPATLMQGAYQLWYGPDLVHVQGRRARRALMLGSMGMWMMGLAWGLYFSYLGNWPLVALDLCMICAGLASAVLIWRKQVQWAAVLIFTTLFAVICLIAWLFDASTPQSPRTTHLYLLPLSVAALMIFRASGPWLRHGIALACLLAMAFLSMRYGSPYPQYALPESVRATGGWVQVTAALGLLYGMLHVMQNDASVRSLLEEELQQALDQQQFVLHYQPQLDSQGRVIAAEALIRWQHPQRGLVLPGKFIEAAEQTGLILPMGLWVLQQAAVQLQAWAMLPACAQLRLAVNISQLQFRQKDFVAQVLGLIDRHGIAAHLLELEITESMLVEDLPDIIQKMTALRACGVTFSLDDFGTGYSSLNHLKRLPLNQLKIDQSFVREVLTDANDASIARTVVTLGHSLGLSVIAEGVESAEQHAFLVACGCEFFQGYLFSQALPADAFNAYVQDNFTRCADARPGAA
ncbi:EAL domain-containing protein [Rhodoferax lacus]|uniref:EAL domain-containing protein n=1 Tax=Rhodoferax lacus TaxID=2184758 RepID=A0A3E1RAX6_9BURK|nr:EAL domain-containing protein [Rhodoferax lacus]RFO96507.1 EAL domain-containing protein [Rhodoferax lacus]